MKKIAILLALLALIVSPALAEPDLVDSPMTQSMRPPASSVDQIRDEANGLIFAVRSERDANADQLAQTMAQNARLTRDLDKAKADLDKAKADLKASDEALDAKDDTK